MKKNILNKWPIKLLIILLTAMFSYHLFILIIHMFFLPMTPKYARGYYLIQIFRSETSAMENLPGDLLELEEFGQKYIRIDNIDEHSLVVGYNPLYKENGFDYIFFVYNEKAEFPNRRVAFLKKDYSFEWGWNLKRIKDFEKFILYARI